MKTITLAITAALSLSTFQSANAEVDFKQAFIIKAIMRVLDTNKNQQIEMNEIKTRWNQAFVMTDKNADKVLTLDEFDALFAARSAQIKMVDPQSKLPSTKAAFNQLDINKNKEITRWEFNKHATDRFKLVDTDNNDAISQDEMFAVKGQLPL